MPDRGIALFSLCEREVKARAEVGQCNMNIEAGQKVTPALNLGLESNSFISVTSTNV